MADRMPHNLTANYAPSSLWLSLPMLPAISGRGNHPASLWAIHWGDQDCWGPGQSNTDTETRRKVNHHWSVMYSSNRQHFSFKLLPFLPAHIYTSLWWSVQPVSNWLWNKCVIWDYSLPMWQVGHIFKNLLKASKSQGRFVQLGAHRVFGLFFTVKGNCPVEVTHTIYTSLKQKTCSEGRQASFLCSHHWFSTALQVTVYSPSSGDVLPWMHYTAGAGY